MAALGSAWDSQAGFIEQVAEPAAFEVEVTPGPGLLDLSWSAVGSAVKYLVFCGLSADQLLPVGETYDVGFSIGSLRGGVQYFVQVLAYFASQRSTASVTENGSGNLVATQDMPFITQMPTPISVGVVDPGDPSQCLYTGGGDPVQPPPQFSGVVSISDIPSMTVSVEYHTADGPANPDCGVEAAVAGVDYQATSGILTWLAGDGGNKSIPISLIFNEANFSKVFRLNLGNPVNCTIDSDTLWCETFQA